MRHISILILLITFYSCEMDEIPVLPHNPGSIETYQIEMESDYRNQVFFDLTAQTISSSNLKTIWDIAFENSLNESKIILNSSNFMKVARISNSQFEDIFDISNLDWLWDDPRGIEFGTAIGNNINNDDIYIIDKGYNLNGNPAGYIKLKIDSINSEYYKFTYAKLDNSEMNTFTINKTLNKNFIYFSFIDNNIVDLEPENWDILFTQYTYLYNDNQNTPAYLVTGALINYLNGIKVAVDTINQFSEISYDMANEYNYSTQRDIIGFNWKTFDFDTQVYTINSSMSYIIQSENGIFYKLRFIDFYNNSGEKGYPKFEIQEL